MQLAPHTHNPMVKRAEMSKPSIQELEVQRWELQAWGNTQSNRSGWQQLAERAACSQCIKEGNIRLCV